MAVKLKTRVTFSEGLLMKLQSLINPIDRATAAKAGRSALKEAKKMISKGTSPIKGRGKFPAYRGSYKKAIKAGKIPGKSLTPVNLKVNGHFLDSFKSQAIRDGGQYAAELFIEGQKQIDKEDGHRDGTNKQAKRPIIPTGNEDLHKDIKSKVRDVYLARIKKLTRS